MKIFSVYKATNMINGKIYIGFDSNWPERKKAHKRKAFNKNYKDYEVALYRAIRKYGWEAFEWEVIYQDFDGEFVLNIIEPYCIEIYESFGPKGYNMTYGGEGTFGHTHSEEIRQSMSEKRSGINNVNYGKFGKDHPSFGHVKTKEGIEKIKQSKIGKSRPDMIGNTWNKGRTAWNKGISPSKETRILWSKQRKGKKRGKYKKGTIQ